MHRGMPWQLLVLKLKLMVDAGDAGVYFTPLTVSLLSLAVHFAEYGRGILRRLFETREIVTHEKEKYGVALNLRFARWK